MGGGGRGSTIKIHWVHPSFLPPRIRSTTSLLHLQTAEGGVSAVKGQLKLLKCLKRFVVSWEEAIRMHLGNGRLQELQTGGNKSTGEGT